MNVGELRRLLADVPDDAEVFYADGNYGGPSRVLDESDISVGETQVLFASPYWTEVE